MSQNANLIIQRIKQNLNIKNDKELSLMLDIKPNTLSTWRKRDTLDFNKIISFCEINDLDLNEIFFPEDGFESVDSAKMVQPINGEEKVEIHHCDIHIIKKVNLVNKNKELSLFNFQLNSNGVLSLGILIGQRVQLKKIKANSDAILVMNNKKVYYEKIKAFSSDFNQLFFDTTFEQSMLSSVATKEIKQSYIAIGYLEAKELNGGFQIENDRLNQILLLEKQLERLKKKF